MNKPKLNIKLKITIDKNPKTMSSDKLDTDEVKFPIQKPFLKWVGGKTQIVYDVIAKFPEKIDNYHEPFLGGGSILLALLSKQKKKLVTIENNIYAYDLNPALINTFNQVKNNHVVVIDKLKELSDTFSNITINTNGQKGAPKDLDEDTYMSTREHYFYWIRGKFNESSKDTAQSAAYFIFINKTDFKGMYREGPNGFNVPYGQKDRKGIPKIFEERTIIDVNELIQSVEFICCDFTDAIKNIKKHDFVYFDPPYVPVTANSFVGYTEEGFDMKIHEKLFNQINDIHKKDIKLLMSNANVELVTSNFKGYKCQEITTRRAIHSKNPESKAKEVLIYN